MYRTSFAAVVFAFLVGGCGASDHSDASSERTVPEARVVNLDNTGNANCPGDFLRYATEGLAFCNTPAQQCMINRGELNQIRCVCAGPAVDNRAPWTCQQVNP